jgi:hypothetical protein
MTAHHHDDTAPLFFGPYYIFGDTLQRLLMLKRRRRFQVKHNISAQIMGPLTERLDLQSGAIKDGCRHKLVGREETI